MLLNKQLNLIEETIKQVINKGKKDLLQLSSDPKAKVINVTKANDFPKKFNIPIDEKKEIIGSFNIETFETQYSIIEVYLYRRNDNVTTWQITIIPKDNPTDYLIWHMVSEYNLITEQYSKLSEMEEAVRIANGNYMLCEIIELMSLLTVNSSKEQLVS